MLRASGGRAAATAGIRGGAVITGLNGQAIASVKMLDADLAELRPGVQVKRSGATRDIRVKLSSLTG